MIDPILELIDNALDGNTSLDAMRWTPDAEQGGTDDAETERTARLVAAIDTQIMLYGQALICRIALGASAMRVILDETQPPEPPVRLDWAEIQRQADPARRTEAERIREADRPGRRRRPPRRIRQQQRRFFTRRHAPDSDEAVRRIALRYLPHRIPDPPDFTPVNDGRLYWSIDNEEPWTELGHTAADGIIQFAEHQGMPIEPWQRDVIRATRRSDTQPMRQGPVGP